MIKTQQPFMHLGYRVEQNEHGFFAIRHGSGPGPAHRLGYCSTLDEMIDEINFEIVAFELDGGRS